MTNALANNEFQVTFEDSRFRTYRATFTRGARGQFAKLTKLERYQTNGKDWFWTLYRSACHGQLENQTKEKMKEMAKMVRYQA